MAKTAREIQKVKTENKITYAKAAKLLSEKEQPHNPPTPPPQSLKATRHKNEIQAQTEGETLKPQTQNQLMDTAEKESAKTLPLKPQV